MPRCSKRTRSGAAELLPGATSLDDHTHKRSRNSRRHARADDTTFSAKKCLAWFKEYTTLSEPEVLGETFISNQLNLILYILLHCYCSHYRSRRNGKILPRPWSGSRECGDVSYCIQNGCQTNGILHSGRVDQRQVVCFKS